MACPPRAAINSQKLLRKVWDLMDPSSDREGTLKGPVLCRYPMNVCTHAFKDQHRHFKVVIFNSDGIEANRDSHAGLNLKILNIFSNVVHR